MDDKFKIVPYTEKFNILHQKEILRIDKDAFGNTSHIWSLDNFTMKIPYKEKLSFYLVHGPENIVVGFLIGSSSCVDASHLNRIAVAKNNTGNGLGKLILKHFLSISKKLGFTKTTLSMIYSKDNLYLLKFYENAGYSILRSKKDILSFLKSKNKLNELDQFYPPFTEGKYIVMSRLL